MRISVGQFGPTGDIAENLQVLGRLTARAAAEGAALAVLPEESMLSQGGLQGGSLAAAAAGGWEEFTAGVQALAREHGVAVIAGGYEPGEADRPFNTLLAVDRTGAVLGTYRKLHLYDAFHHRESDTVTPGDGGPVQVRIGEMAVGLLTCYDLRFPELSRALAVGGADVLVVPAAWFAGEHKVEHWCTLLTARAVENTVWVAAADTCSDATVGHSRIIDPWGVPVAALRDEREALVTAEVGRERLDEVRSVLPVLANRRADVL